MPRDYKNSTYRGRKPLKKPRIDGWDRFLLIVFISLLAVGVRFFLNASPKDNQVDLAEKTATASSTVVAAAQEVLAAGNLSPEELAAEPSNGIQVDAEIQAIEKQKQIAQAKAKAEAEAKAKAEAEKPPRQDSIPTEPHFDFYTILPAMEVVIPDHEIKTRIREEKIGQGDENAKYIMQAGSFRDTPEAQQLQNRLATMGIASRIEKAQVGEVTWYRVKVGPYSGMTNVMAIKTRLHDSGVDAIVLEFK
jgi:cell division protein FtsN